MKEMHWVYVKGVEHGKKQVTIWHDDGNEMEVVREAETASNTKFTVVKGRGIKLCTDGEVYIGIEGYFEVREAENKSGDKAVLIKLYELEKEGDEDA